MVWQTTGEMLEAGDVFGDAQSGPAWGLVYTNTTYPQERLRAAFGVIVVNDRYSAHVEFVHEQLIAGDWEVTDESDESGVFYCDYDSYRQALVDVEREMQRWKGFSFSNEVWSMQV